MQLQSKKKKISHKNGTTVHIENLSNQSSTTKQVATDSEVCQVLGHSAYSPSAVVEVAAVAGVALHPQVTGCAR